MRDIYYIEAVIYIDPYIACLRRLNIKSPWRSGLMLSCMIVMPLALIEIL